MFKINKLEKDYLTYGQLLELQEVRLGERLWVGFAIMAVLGVSVFDVIEDWQEHQQIITIAGDLLYMGVMLGLLLYIWRFLPFSLNRVNLLLTQEVVKKHQDADRWKTRAADLLAGFSSLISEQLTQWQASNAEKEVALLLLKGLSIKEIAVLRNTSDNTVRQQAASLYAKAGLKSRAELSAFFLEDLLLVEPQGLATLDARE